MLIFIDPLRRPRGTCDTTPSLSESTVIQEAVGATQTAQTAQTDALPAAAIKPCLGGAHGAGKGGPKTKPSAQLANYLNSPSPQNPYIRFAVPEGRGAVKQHAKDVEKYLEGWGKNWEKIAAAKDK